LNVVAIGRLEFSGGYGFGSDGRDVGCNTPELYSENEGINCTTNVTDMATMMRTNTHLILNVVFSLDPAWTVLPEIEK
jgi:hypothetical protein